MGYDSYAGGNFGAGFLQAFGQIFSRGVMQQHEAEMREKEMKERAKHHLADLVINAVNEDIASGDPIRISQWANPNALDPVAKIDAGMADFMGASIAAQLGTHLVAAQQQRAAQDKMSMEASGNVLGGGLGGGPTVPFRRVDLSPEEQERTAQILYDPKNLPDLMRGQRETSARVGESASKIALSEARVESARATTALRRRELAEVGKATEVSVFNNAMDNGANATQAREIAQFAKTGKPLSPATAAFVKANPATEQTLQTYTHIRQLEDQYESFSTSDGKSTRKGLLPLAEEVVKNAPNVETAAQAVDTLNRNVVAQAAMHVKAGDMSKNDAIQFIRRGVRGLIESAGRFGGTKRELVPSVRFQSKLKDGVTTIIDPASYEAEFNKQTVAIPDTAPLTSGTIDLGVEGFRYLGERPAQ